MFPLLSPQEVWDKVERPRNGDNSSDIEDTFIWMKKEREETFYYLLRESETILHLYCLILFCTREILQNYHRMKLNIRILQSFTNSPHRKARWCVHFVSLIARKLLWDKSVKHHSTFSCSALMPNLLTRAQNLPLHNTKYMAEHEYTLREGGAGFSFILSGKRQI